MPRKLCKRCKGTKKIHLDNCEAAGTNSTVLDGTCVCDPFRPPSGGWMGTAIGLECPDCRGTGERQRTQVAP